MICPKINECKVKVTKLTFNRFCSDESIENADYPHCSKYKQKQQRKTVKEWIKHCPAP